LLPAIDCLLGRLVLDHFVGSENPAPVGIGIYHRTAADNTSRIKDGVAAYLRVVAQQGAKFPHSRVDKLAVQFDTDISRQEFDVRDLGARTQVSRIAQNRIANIIKMWRDGVVEQQGILYFACVSDDAIVSHNDIFANIRVMPNLTVSPDNGRAFDHRPILNNRPQTDENLLAYESHPFASIVQPGPQIGLQIGSQLSQGLPGAAAPVEERRVLGLAQIEQILGFDHEWES